MGSRTDRWSGDSVAWAGGAAVLVLVAALVVGLGLVVCFVDGIPAAAAANPVPSASTGVVGDNDNDLYVGTGGVIYPSSQWRSDSAGRRAAAGCEGCGWRITVSCTRAQIHAGGCPASRVGCRLGTLRVAVWVQHPGGPWLLVGFACQGPRAPRTVADIGSAVHDREVALLPPLRLGVEPPDGALVGLPAFFRSGQRASGLNRVRLPVLNLNVVLTAQPRWHWLFGDVGEIWTAKPGGRWPDISVSHAYRRTGRVRVWVQSIWRAEFTAEGLGPFPVPGPPLTQDSALLLVVRPAHGVLVG